MARPTQYQKLSLQLDAENKKLKAKLAQTKSSMGKLSGVASKLGGVIAGVFAVGAVVSFGKEAMNLAGIAEGVQAAFMRLNNPMLLENLRKATRGTVNDLDLMKAAVKAENFKVPLNKLAIFFEFATKRAAQTGESVDYLVESLVNGIGRKSALVLDNLGISAAELQEEIKKTGDFGLAAGNIIQRELAKAGDVATTSAMKTASWGASIDNLKVAIGTELNKALNLVAPIIDDITKNLVVVFNQGKTGIRNVTNEFIKLYNQSTSLRVVLISIGNTFDVLWEAIKLGIKSVAIPLKNITASLVDLFSGNFKSAVRNAKEIFTETGDAFKTFGERVAEDFNEGLKAAFDAEELPLLTDDDQAVIEGKSEGLGTKMGIAIGKGLKAVFNTEEGPLPVILTNIEKIKTSTEAAFEAFTDQQGIVIEGWTTMADIVGRMANGIANAKDNWAAMGATMLSGFVQLTPLIQEQIANIKKLMIAKKSEAVGSAIASGAAVPFPGNLIAIATGIATVLTSIAPFIGSFATGIDYVPKTGLAMLHKGEKVTPAASNVGGNQLVAVVKGADLHFVMNEYGRRRGDSY